MTALIETPKNSDRKRVLVRTNDRLYKKIIAKAKKSKISVAAVVRQVLCQEFKVKDPIKPREFTRR